MKTYVVPILFFLAVPVLAIPITVLSTLVFGMPEYSAEAAAYFKSVNYVMGIWIGYMFWGRA